MNVTAGNWKKVERHLKKAGIQNAIYDYSGFLQTIICKSGVKYEFSPETLKELLSSGAVEVRLGKQAIRS